MVQIFYVDSAIVLTDIRGRREKGRREKA